MNKGTAINAVKINIIAVKKSIHPPTSLGNPIKDLINNTIPKTIKICEGISVKILKPNIVPAATSIAPKILTNMFFKLSFYLKKYQLHALVTQPGLECHPPKVEVEGSNPSKRV